MIGIEVFHRPRFVPRCQSQTFRQRIQSTAQHRQGPRRARHIPARHPGDHHDGLGIGGLEGEGGTGPQAPGEVAGAGSLVGGCGTSAAGVSAPSASLRAPGAIEGGEVGSPLRGVPLAGEALQPGDDAPDNHPTEFALRKLVCCMIAKTLAVRLCRRDLGGRYRRIMARPQVAVAVAMAVLPRSPPAPLAHHDLPSRCRASA